MAAPVFLGDLIFVDLDFVRIECDIITDSPVQLTGTLYNALRSFETHFKASYCQAVAVSCTSCRFYVDCPYQIVFSQQLSSDPEIVRSHQKPSLPFSLFIREIDSDTSSITVSLTIIGTAVNYVELFHASLKRMVKIAIGAVLASTEFRLLIYCIDYQGLRHEIRDSSSLTDSIILLSGQYILQNSINSDSVKLSLQSPLRLFNNGSIVHHFDFSLLFRTQLRRCSSLCAYYGAGEMDLDFSALSQASKAVCLLEDAVKFTQPKWSNRPNYGGLTGIAECIGLTEDMFALLLLGSYFNAGKGAALGLGFYQVEVL
jgi:hypothetical protein